MQFSPLQYNRLRQRLRRRYQTLLKRVYGELKKQPKHKTADWLKAHHLEIEEFSPVRWYFLKQLESLAFFITAPLRDDQVEFSAIEDEVFEAWNRSEFADVFLKLLNKGKSLKQASRETTQIFDQHLVALGNLHLLKVDKPNQHYRIQGSLGDVKKKNTRSNLLETTLHLEGKELGLKTSSLKEMKNFSTRIEVACKVIRHFSPSSWERFQAFTEVIIPISQKEFVSYSHQELPGTSMINLYDRDFVDLLDDLIHENGHHHLNYYLNLETLIQEPIGCIYYSPWRRTLRPLRGIYHAYFTFFWAFKLFSDMVSANDMDSIFYVFNEKEKEKIIWRAVEEYHMLCYSYFDLKWARKQKLISDDGWKLIKEQHALLNRFKKKIPAWEKQLKVHKKELKELKKVLIHSQKKYLK
jgi:hypothetical protein